MKSFLPPKRLLMGPGPSDVHKRILNAMARQTIGHLDPAFIEMMDETKQMLKYAFMTENELTCLLYTSPSPRDQRGSRMPSSA